jgi:hypothetical protein
VARVNLKWAQSDPVSIKEYAAWCGFDLTAIDIQNLRKDRHASAIRFLETLESGHTRGQGTGVSYRRPHLKCLWCYGTGNFFLKMHSPVWFPLPGCCIIPIAAIPERSYSFPRCCWAGRRVRTLEGIASCAGILSC